MAGSIGKRIYSTTEWKAARLVALDRDGYRCRTCGKAGRLEVHHVLPIHLGGEPFRLSNLKSICRDCHFRGASEAAARGRCRFAVECVDEELCRCRYLTFGISSSLPIA